MVAIVAVSTALIAACSTGGDDLSLAASSASTSGGSSAPAEGGAQPEPTDDRSTEAQPRDEAGSLPSAPSPLGDEIEDQSSAGRGDEEPADISLEPRDDRTRRARPEQCLALAGGPWTEVDCGRDPLRAIRDGEVPGIPDGGDHQPFEELVEFPTLESYEDVSTLQDPDAVKTAWAEAGYDDGVMAEYHEGNYQFQVAAVRFRDGLAAGQALTAHLLDYCQRSVEARRVPTGNGVTVLRDLGAVRTLWVEGDVLLSTFACVCFADDDPSRQDLVEGWAGDVSDELTDPAPGTDTV